MRGDAFTKYLWTNIKHIEAAYRDAYKSSFIDEDSNNYDSAQRLSGELKSLRLVLTAYQTFKGWHSSLKWESRLK